MPHIDRSNFDVLIGPTNLNQKDIDGINELLKQLSNSFKELDKQKIDLILGQPNFRLIIFKCYNTGEMIGIATLYFEKTLMSPDGIGKIEDVVIGKNYRGLGLGEEIMNYIISLAKGINLSRIDLTSNPNNPNRKIAIKLYEKLGFEKKDGYFSLNMFSPNINNRPNWLIKKLRY